MCISIYQIEFCSVHKQNKNSNCDHIYCSLELDDVYEWQDFSPVLPLPGSYNLSKLNFFGGEIYNIINHFQFAVNKQNKNSNCNHIPSNKTKILTGFIFLQSGKCRKSLSPRAAFGRILEWPGHPKSSSKEHFPQKKN